MICCFIQPSPNVRKSSNDRSCTGAAASTSVFAADITVAGSTFIYPVLSNWADAGAMRVATDIERIGDLAKNMGKRVAALESDFHPLKLIRSLEHMTDLVQSQVKSVLDAYAAHDLPAAMTVWKGDEKVDAICTSLFRELLTYMMEDPRNISFCIHLMFCAKNIERIGDHATNIAETVFYTIEGQQIADKRPKGDMTTFATAVPGN